MKEGNILFTHGVEETTDGGFSFYQINGSNILRRQVRESPTSMTVHCKAGSRVTKLVGDLPGYGTVWYDPTAIANILSVKKFKNKYHVSYSSNGDGVFFVTKPNSIRFEFKESYSGLCYIDTVDHIQNQVVMLINLNQGVMMVNTVSNKKNDYTNEDYECTVKSHELQIKIGRPSYKDFFKNCD
jgi:hypothetical protein